MIDGSFKQSFLYSDFLQMNNEIKNKISILNPLSIDRISFANSDVKHVGFVVEKVFIKRFEKS